MTTNAPIEKLIEECDYNLTGFIKCCSSMRFWQYFAMLFLANIFGGFFSYEYKPIGNSVNMSDDLLSWAGSASAIV